MLMTNLIDEDMINYKEVSMFIGTPYCSGKCWKELGLPPETCQNECLRDADLIDYYDSMLIDRYRSNPLSKAIVFGGLEPLDSFEYIRDFVLTLRNMYGDMSTVVIYTGYREDEIKEQLEEMKDWYNIIVKVGRYIPNRKSRYDKILGVTLASDNQYAIKL